MWRVTAMGTDKWGYFVEVGEVYTFDTFSQARYFMSERVKLNGYRGIGPAYYRAIKCGGCPLQCKVDGTKEHYYGPQGYWTE